jgi:hypothetical protein
MRFNIHQQVAITCSGEVGTIIGRSEHANAENQYLVRYKAADGRAVESWWAQSALTEV